jgi:hypothetical protein
MCLVRAVAVNCTRHAAGNWMKKQVRLVTPR